jgi:orotate phosphoribosyltransferase
VPSHRLNTKEINMHKKATLAAQLVPDDALVTLKNCDGYYDCPKGPDGELLGPLVGYAGRYDDGNGKKLQYVGLKYYNFARAERFPHACSMFAEGIRNLLASKNIDFDVIVGAPMGGIILSAEIARVANRRRGFMEKKVTKLATETGKEESVLITDRHELSAGEDVILGEDVVNNMSTTDKAWKLITSFDARLVAITCAFNRSGKRFFQAPDGSMIPIICYEWIPTEQYRQDDPVVAEYVAKGQVIWKPKDNWSALKAAMEAYAEA